MILCPNCQHKEVSGAVFCSHCGAQLLEAETAKTHLIETAEGRKANLKQTTSNFRPPPPAAMDSWLSLHITETGQILTLADRNEFTLGRVAESQPIMPDVDLTPYNAYAHGVSRLHAVIKLINNRVIIMDLGSSNGTYVGGNRLSPYVECPLQHGDFIHLGKLKIQVLFGQRDQDKG